jgi:ceramide glucosyltransferase
MLLALEIIAVVGSVSACAYYVLCLTAVKRFAGQMQSIRPISATPPISILKPLCGADPHAYENLRSHCEQDYPEFEIIFGVSDPADPSIKIADRLSKEFPARAIRLVVCPATFGSNFKVSNLIQMFPHARYPYILVNDSDICVSRNYLQHVAGEFRDDRVGLVTCLYRGIAGRTLGSRLEALGINTDFLPSVLLAERLERGIRFGLGSTLALRRSALEAIGGFAAVSDYLGDDYELGKRTAQAGFEVRLAKTVVDHYLPNYSFTDYLRHQLRWARTVRASRPAGFAGLIVTFGFFWALLALLISKGAWAYIVLALVAVLKGALALTSSNMLNDREMTKDFWLMPIRDIVSLGIWAGSYAGRRIVWRGSQFTLENGKLRP